MVARSYWVSAVYPGYTRRLASLGNSSSGFPVFNPTCSNHSQCPSMYCDSSRRCALCEDCLLYGDAVDGVCPTVCGATTTPFVLGETRPNQREDLVSRPVRAPILPTCPSFLTLVDNNNADIDFAATTSTSYPRKMTTSLSSKLNLLALNLRTSVLSAFRLFVLSAYEVAPAGVSAPKYSFEGRSLNITLTPTPTPSQVANLALLASAAGFDFVSYPSASYVYVSVVPDRCQSKLDLVILLDASGSIDDPAYGGLAGTFFGRVIPFARSLAEFFEIGQNATRISIATFQTGATLYSTFDSCFNFTCVNATINRVTYPAGGTHTSTGLTLLQNQVFLESKGMRPLSEGVSRVLVVVTDGVATAGYDPTTAAASLRENLGVNIFSVGVGCNYDIDQLNAMATSPISTHVFVLKSFAVINLLLTQMTSVTCSEPAVLTPGNSTQTTVSACEIKYFRPQCGLLTNQVFVRAQDLTGSTSVFLSTSDANPGPFSFSQRDLNSTIKMFTVSQAPDSVQPVYIGVQGVAASSNVLLDVYSGLFCF